MGSESKIRNVDGCGGGGGLAAAQGIPETAKKLVRNVKEIVNCTEQEIYAVLMECDMDPNRAVERLLAQDTFQEVRSKRERRKETKEAIDSRRGNNVGSSRGGKIGAGSDRNVVQDGLTHAAYNELGKAAAKGEVGSVFPSVTSSTTHVVGKSTKIDSCCTDNGRQSLGPSDSTSASAQVSPRLQPSLLGVRKGHLSMADIVRMGRTSQDDVSHNHYSAPAVSASGISESNLSLYCENNSEQQVFHDEWPVIEQPITDNSQAPNLSASSNANWSSEHPSLHDTAVSLHRNYELDAAEVSWGDIAHDIASVSSQHTIMSSNDGLRVPSNSNLKNTGSSDFHNSHEHHEDVSSATSVFQRLCIGDSKLQVSSSEDNPTVVLPNHLQALAAECSHLSFGTYNGGSNSASTMILASNLSKSGLEENPAAIDGSSALFLDASSAYHGDKRLGFDVRRGTTVGKNHDFLPSHHELLKHIIPVETLGHEQNKMASVLDPSLQKSQWVTQPGLQGENYSTFPRETHGDSDSMPGDVLAFLTPQSQSARFSNAVSSKSNPAISLSEVMEPGAFASHIRSALPQDLSVQSLMQYQQMLDRKGYLSLPQNQSYMTTTNSQQQAFSGSTAYNQSHADMNYYPPQNKNEFLMSRLPAATARDALGYGNLGSSFYSSGSFPSNPSLGYTMASSNFDEILPSQYNGGRNLSSIQQPASFPRWDVRAESRSSFLPNRTLYDALGQPSQASRSQFVRPGYSDLYHSQTPVVEEVQRPGGFQDLSSKQLQQFWCQNH